ncbi:MFS transporter [Peristeroidobacter soli]|jgi:sugar phosphate permease|uniref:MFS transporter n=1 Tax=Peristeroidobacter soli TaxID=2497877 RepID=UPI00101DB8ED|nr:MFS transporter [Peristeroidobacter soli]
MSMKWAGRHSVLAVVFATYLVCFMDRMVIASVLPAIVAEFSLDSLQAGMVLSAFFVGYSAMQIPGGILADRYGPRRVIACSLVVWSVCIAGTGLVNSLGMLLVMRLLFGAGEGVFPAAASKSLVLWFPAHELGRANGIKLAATQIGPAIAPPFAAFMILMFGWRGAFMALLLPGLLLLPFVLRYIKEPPASSSSEVVGEPAKIARATAALEVFRSRQLLWCAVVLFLSLSANWTILSWLPTYLIKVHGFTLSKMGIYAAIPALGGTVGYYLGGFISDRYFSGRRVVPISMGLAASAVFTFMAAESATGEMAVAFLTLTLCSLCVALSGLFTLPLLVVPKRLAGTALGVANTAGQCAGLLSPLAVGWLLSSTSDNYQVVLLALVGLLATGAAAAWLIRECDSEPGAFPGRAPNVNS